MVSGTLVYSFVAPVLNDKHFRGFFVAPTLDMFFESANRSYKLLDNEIRALEQCAESNFRGRRGFNELHKYLLGDARVNSHVTLQQCPQVCPHRQP